MTIGEIIQNVATGAAVLLGITYVIGGLIVNLNLTRRGVVEYQILKVKYLAVGIIFILHFLGVVLFALIPVVLIATFAGNASAIQTVSQIISIPSILAALTLLYVWTRLPPNTNSLVGKWWFWFTFSVVATIFPLFVLLHQAIVPLYNLQWVFNTVMGILVGALTIMAQIYHYSAFYYGKPAGLGISDPIGMGIPTLVDLVCEEKLSPDLKELGLPVLKNIIHDVYLIDETNEHYLVSQERVPGGTGNNQTYKINKGLVKVILHKPAHMRRLAGDPGNKAKKRS
jgi:hypothetical protein